jgi:hypothetical protein
MKNIFEISTAPAARVVSVGTLRSMEASVELDRFTDQTLAEVQFIASILGEIQRIGEPLLRQMM